uniref:Uncharacterized protein n=1 Tax=Callorhinchus milii TaxID=7868 RepID=A0A4W3IVJ9_CALMI
ELSLSLSPHRHSPPHPHNDHCVYSDLCYFPVSLISRLQGNDLTADCTEDLASVISINLSMTELSLSRNKLGDSGVKRLCESLRNPKCKLQSLSLTSETSTDLASALIKNRSLTELNLNRNALGDSGVKGLCDTLRTPDRSLRKLDLGFNSFTDDSVPALHRLIKTCTSLEGIR